MEIDQEKSQDDAGLGPFVVMPAVVVLDAMNSNLLENAHDGLEKVGHGLRILCTAFFIHDLPLVGDLVRNVLVQEVVGRIRVGPIDFVGVSLAAMLPTIPIMMAGGQRGFSEAVVSLSLLLFVLFLATPEVIMPIMTSTEATTAATKVTKTVVIVASMAYSAETTVPILMAIVVITEASAMVSAAVVM